MLMRCLALDLAPDDILVNEVAPGYVDAGLSRSIFDARPGRREAATARVPNGRLITPEEVAREVAHLCEPETRHCIGATVLMDGGLSLRTPGDNRDG
jgi:NAD(P)-dependent dehydrogenase (short-subunit alcohol dehydrogenase family)